MRKLFILIAFVIGANFTQAQEVIIESANTANVFNSETFQTETTKIYVELDGVFIRWNEDGTGGIFQFSATLKTASGATIVTHTMNKSISVLDAVSVPISVHSWIRDQVYNAVISVDPYGLTAWSKLY